MDLNCDVKEEVINQLIQHFLRGCLKFTLKPEEATQLTWSEQQSFLNATVHNPLIKKYPVNNDFCRLFFKKLINYLELKTEVHDDFYTYLCSVMESDLTGDDYCYRHYTVKNNSSVNDVITIKETKNIVVNGTTGMRTWEAAFMISDWALCNQELFKDKKILELGSGVGFSGIAIAKHCGIQSFVMTDCHHDVLQTICENVRINLPDMNCEEIGNSTVFRDDQKTVGVAMLDWNCIEEIPLETVPDIVLGADIVYDPSILQPLCNVLKKFFDRNKQLHVYIASVIRNEETFNRFLEILDTMNIQWEKLTQTRNVFINWDASIYRSLLRLKM